MKITAIKAQVKRAGRYSIFVDNKYAFSLSDTALLESKLIIGQAMSDAELADFKQLSEDDKVYAQAINYIALRPRSTWEIQTYLERKKATDPLIESIIAKLTKLKLLDDVKFAGAFVRDRAMLKPTSQRKLQMELKKRHIDSDIVRQVFEEEAHDEKTALQELVARKRRQTKYQNDTKLMQYLAGQGFNYSDIKQALSGEAFYD